VVAAAAIALQTVLLFALYRASRAQREQLTQLAAKIEPLAERSQQVIEDVRKQVGDVTARLSEVLELSRKQLTRADHFMEEAVDRARAQMSRVEMVLDDAMSRFQETFAMLNRAVLQPLRQLHGITLGVRATLAALFGERRTTVERATHDEEMFI
jgi:uncharacterized protein YydD (DUF2326 family)